MSCLTWPAVNTNIIRFPRNQNTLIEFLFLSNGFIIFLVAILHHYRFTLPDFEFISPPTPGPLLRPYPHPRIRITLYCPKIIIVSFWKDLPFFGNSFNCWLILRGGFFFQIPFQREKFSEKNMAEIFNRKNYEVPLLPFSKWINNKSTQSLTFSFLKSFLRIQLDVLHFCRKFFKIRTPTP